MISADPTGGFSLSQVLRRMPVVIALFLCSMLVLICPPTSSRAAGWKEQVHARIEAFKEFETDFALVTLSVDSLVTGLTWEGRQLHRSEIIGSVDQVHLGSIQSRPRLFVRVSVSLHPVWGAMYAGSFFGSTAQRWIKPGDQVLALLARPSQSALEEEDGDGQWWIEGNWWEVDRAAQIRENSIVVVTAVAPQETQGGPPPDSEQEGFLQMEEQATEHVGASVADVTDSIRQSITSAERH